MYLKNIGIKNIGPISKLSVELPFDENGNPKPLLFVGQNGSGKTILQSQIIDSLYEIGSNIFSDVGIQDINARSYYKLSGSINLKSGSSNGFSLISYLDKERNKIEYFDKTGKTESEEFKCFIDNYNLNPNSDNSNQKTITQIQDVQKDKLIEEWNNGVHFYQPAYRYEEPFWKNEPFIDYQRFGDKKRFSGKLDKEIEIISATKENKEYLMNLVLDFMNNPKNAIDKITWTNINNILRKIKKTKNIRFGIGPRGGYRVSIVETDKSGNAMTQLLPSIDNLSLGESILLNLFVNIIRHGDTPPKLPNQIEGIIAVDEIDVHLHSDLQNTVLPELIKMFPKVQFIITTHSPLFILGMRREFGEDGFEIRNMPTGEKITSERFSEFENAYSILKNTEKFEAEIKELRKKEHSFDENIFIITEGKSDWKYIISALKHFHSKGEFEEIEEKYFFKYGTKKDVDSEICGTKIEVEMGDKKLKKYLSDRENEILRDSKKLVIGIFDSDNDNIKIVNNECMGIYSFKIEPSGISTEFLFEDEDLFKEVDGRKLYLGENFNQKSGRFNDLNLGGNSINKAGKKIIIDDCVFDSLNKNIALTKDRFATAVFNNEITISSKSFENFRHIFEKIKQIIDAYDKKMEE